MTTLKIDTEFLDEYSKMISKYLWSKKLEGRDEFDNLYSMVVIKLMESVNKYDKKRGKVSTWITWVMRTVVSNYFRHKQQDATHNALPVLEDMVEEFTDSLLAILRNATSLLTQEEHRLIIQHYHEGYSHREIANALGRNENAVKVQIHRARTKLIDQIQGELSDKED